MLKTGYTINPGKSAVIDFDEKNFASEVHQLGENGYEFEQDFDNHDISQFRTIVLVKVSPTRVEEVKELYDIAPAEVRITVDDEIEYVFRFTTSLYPKRGYPIARELAQLYDGDYRLYKRWKEQCKAITNEKIFVAPAAIRQIFASSSMADSINEGAEHTVNLIDIEDVARRLKHYDKVDTTLNIAPGIGPNFHLAVHILGSVETAYRFFNNEYQSGFITDTEDGEQYIVDGTTLTASGVYVSPNGGYVRAGASGGQDVKMTNFTISIHYKLEQQSGEIVFVVSMTNERGHVVENVEWKNQSSETAILDFVMKFGNFHIYGGKASIIKLHEMVTTASVPTIYTVAQYGYNIYRGNRVMVFPDGVYDMDNNKFFPKHDTLPYYFLGGHDGMGIDNDTEAAKVSKEQVPLFGQITNSKFEDYLAISSSIYKGNTPWILWMFACSMAGVAAYYHDKAVPSYYVSGVTGSGKSTFAQFLATAFGVENLYNIRESTVFPIKVILSAFKGLPAFLSEFRTEMKYAPEKLGLIQMCYDRSETGKGLKNGGMLKYKMESQVFCEGEDTYGEGSIRSRSIMFEAQKSDRMTGVLPLQIMRDNKRVISSFFANYLHSTCQQDYDKYKLEGQKLFAKSGVEPRLSDNMGIMYAGCMTFAPERKTEFLEQCHALLAKQVEDYNENGESQKVITLLAQYLNKAWARVYTQDGYLILDWNDIREYKDKSRVTDMKLSMNSYLGHLKSLGWDNDYYEVTRKDDFGQSDVTVINGVRIAISKCPRDLFTNQKVYAYHREMKKEAK